MATINENFLKLPGSYLFSEVAKRTAAFLEKNPDTSLLRLGIGDVTLPLTQKVVQALHEGADEMGDAATFRGYGPEHGYDFLRECIAEHEYAPLGAPISPGEIIIGDGAKSDTANIQELFGPDNVVAVTDPVYPVYVDSNAMAGRAGIFEDGKWSKIVYMPMVKENDYTPQLPEGKVDLIYLCSPNNPTGAALSTGELKKWVDYALENEAVILFDAAYRAFIRTPGVARSIYEVEGAEKCAIEFGSFSKTAGFTGTRCSWTVVPQALRLRSASGEKVSLHALWCRRQATKFNGTPYLVQKAAAAIYCDQGKAEIQALIDHYMDNAACIRESLESHGIQASGGVDSPYVWFPVPGGDSWAFFDRLLEEAHIIGTPGAGFGPSGEGYFRLTAFGTPENTREACRRITKIL